MDKRIIAVCFFLAGFATFVYEIAWAKPLQIIFGSTIYATSTILAAFLAGFSLGSFIFAKKADRSKDPQMLFGILELCLGIYGIAIIGVFKTLPLIYSSFFLFSGAKIMELGFCFILLLIPASIMGAVWPVANRLYAGKEESRDAGLLYSSNNLGSFFGALAAGFILMPILGVLKTSILASIVNILISAIIFYKGGKDGK